MSSTPVSHSPLPFMLLTPAQGSIEAGDGQLDRLEEFTQRVGSGEFHVETAGKIPCKCIDGRCSQLHDHMPNAAGGTETLMVADDLTVKRFAGLDSSTKAQYHTLLAHLNKSGYPVGGHTADDLHGAPSGCGANDKLPAIYEFIATNGETLHSLSAKLGVVVDDETHDMILGNAANRSEFSNGDELLAELEAACSQASVSNGVDKLHGEHREVIAVINTRPGTTLDRDAVREEFGDDYQAFNVDVWAFGDGAWAITEDDGATTERAQKVAAMVYYNLATACVLCGPNMRVVVLG